MHPKGSPRPKASETVSPVEPGVGVSQVWPVFPSTHVWSSQGIADGENGAEGGRLRVETRGCMDYTEKAQGATLLDEPMGRQAGPWEEVTSELKQQCGEFPLSTGCLSPSQGSAGAHVEGHRGAGHCTQLAFAGQQTSMFQMWVPG